MNKNSPRNLGGRPSIYTQELADRICHKLAEGNSLRTVCKGEGMPDISTIFNWFRTAPGFVQQYARAKEESADAMVEEMLDIADNGENDTYVRKDEEGNAIEGVNHDHINRSRLRVDVRKWAASKLKPKKYGEKIHAEHSGADGGPIKYTVVTGVPDPADDRA